MDAEDPTLMVVDANLYSKRKVLVKPLSIQVQEHAGQHFQPSGCV